jgi:DNA (cytosine-5)-methyltransferase 1
MCKEIPVIDLFAGPGGLGEGFSALRGPGGDHAFRVRLSIEMVEHSHQTLLLRSVRREKMCRVSTAN